ncbi:MAG: SIS domain-containing protein [Candidatus Omnitrophica bacterium]|nr:SIS domain-containing protein [Candidatus Omnitrophota bacterium]
MDVEQRVRDLFKESVRAKEAFREDEGCVRAVSSAAEAIAGCLKRGGQILVFGNGGSAADSQHLAAELVVRFESDRKALPCISLNVNNSVLTAAGNDYSFEEIFSRQIEALGRPGDIAFAISTSGNSPNVTKGARAAREKGLKVISLTGKSGGALAALSDIAVIAPSEVTARIQEVHITAIHAICKLVEEAFTK